MRPTCPGRSLRFGSMSRHWPSDPNPGTSNVGVMSLHATLGATVDGDVTFAFEVTNDSAGPAELTFRSGKRADVAVTDTDTGEEVWRWSEGRMFTQAIQTVEIDAEESFDQTFTWSDPPAGTYEAEATLAASPGASATTTFSV